VVFTPPREASHTGYQRSTRTPQDEFALDCNATIRFFHYQNATVLPVDDDRTHPDEHIEGLWFKFRSGMKYAYDSTTCFDAMFPLTQFCITDHSGDICLILRDGTLQTIRAHDMKRGGKYGSCLYRLYLARLGLDESYAFHDGARTPASDEPNATSCAL
jgi:hypothetical protein